MLREAGADLATTLLEDAPVFADLPVYSTYELAPPTGWLTSREDQQIAGILMKVGGALVLWTAMSVIFFRWYRRENPEP